MFRKSLKVRQTIESHKEGNENKSRFQIVKLEERIAPSPGVCYDHGRRGCPGGGGYHGHGHGHGR